MCPFCKSTTIFKKISLFSKILDKNIIYNLCKKCRSINQEDIPDLSEIKKYYESYIEVKSEMNPGYLSNSNLDSFFNERDKTMREIGFDLVNIVNGTNLELGCANGHFLRYLKEHKATDITGIDISQRLLDSIDIEGVKLLLGDLSLISPSSVDNLFLFNVLEHIDDIDKTLKEVVRITKDSSNIIIELPLSGVVSNYFGAGWRFLMPNEHLHIPSIKGFKLFLSSYDLKIVGLTRFGSGYTTGMIDKKVKLVLDRLAKVLKFGDRGAFLIKKIKV